MANDDVQMGRWRDSRGKRLAAALAYPVVLLLNRPALARLADAVYDVALRMSGIAITFGGRHGLTRAEENFLSRHQARLKGGVLLDVGANHGAYALELARLAPDARIFAFEPHPVSLAVLREQISGRPAIQPVGMAMGARAGAFQLFDFADADGSTQASLSESAVTMYASDVSRHDVRVTTVDDFMAEQGLTRIDLLKIDTEGHDLDVLRGAAKALAERRIGMIQFEFIPANIVTGATMRGFFEVLRGYRIHRLCLNGTLRPLPRYDVKRCEIFITQNLIALPDGA